MAKKIFQDRIQVSIDVGTTKICVLVAHQLHGKTVEILGVGKAPSDGLKKGVVVDVAKTIRSIKLAVKEAELMSGITITAASIGISGGHIKSANSSGMISIKHGEIKPHDLANVLAAARAMPIDQGMQILHVLPQYYVIDSREKVQNPLGMHGVRLEVQAHIILGAIASVQNLVKCVQQAGIKVTDIVLEQLASAAAVLSKDEQELGVGVLDIGGGTADLALYQQGNIRHTMVLPIAGNHFTHDLAVGLKTTIAEAERIKQIYGLCHAKYINQEKIISYSSLDGNSILHAKSSDILRILHPRAQELLSIVHDEICKYKLHTFMPSGLVITGGGSLLPGIQELAQEIFKTSVRLGSPQLTYDLPESLKSPIYATGYGLLLFTIEQKEDSLLTSTSGPMLTRIVVRMKSWVSDFF